MSPVKEVLVSAMLIILLVKVRDCSSAESERPETKVDMRDLQNSSSCTYLVDPVVGYNKWLLKQLYHIKCVNKDSLCPGTQHRNFTCLQTTKDIILDTETSEKLILYTGCVCGYKVENTTSVRRTYD